jgi:hypothetical protein
LEVCIQEGQVFLGEGRWSWLGGFSLFFRDLSRFALQLFQLLCNGQNFPLIGKFTINQVHRVLERWNKEEQVYLGEGCWSWLGCFSLFFRDLSRFALQLFQLLCNGQNFPLIGKLTKTQDTVL